MNGFVIFDGNAGEYDTRNHELRQTREYPVGFAVRFVEWAGGLSAPLPVLSHA